MPGESTSARGIGRRPLRRRPCPRAAAGPGRHGGQSAAQRWTCSRPCEGQADHNPQAHEMRQELAGFVLIDDNDPDAIDISSAATVPPGGDCRRPTLRSIRADSANTASCRAGAGGMGRLPRLSGEPEATGSDQGPESAPFHQSTRSLLPRGQSGALLNHPNIVHNLAWGQDRATGQHYLVMEYVDGPAADALLEKTGKLSVGDAVHITLDDRPRTGACPFAQHRPPRHQARQHPHHQVRRRQACPTWAWRNGPTKPAT